MAWTYFTTDLAPGDVLTKDQRDELLDAIEERCLATNHVTFASSMSDVDASDLVTSLIARRIDGGSASNVRMHDLLRYTVAPYYARSDTATEMFTDTTWYEDLASEMGMTTTELGVVFTSLVDSADYWNAIRAGVRLLKHLRFSPGTHAYRSRSASNQVTWSDATTAFLGSEGTSSSSPVVIQAQQSSSSPYRYSISGYAHIVDYTIPSAAVFTVGWEMWMIVDVTDTSAVFVADIPTVEIGASTYSAASALAPATSNQKLVFATGLTDVGALTIKFRLGGYEDGAVLNAYEPSLPSNNVKSSRYLPWANIWYLFGTPTFTHP